MIVLVAIDATAEGSAAFEYSVGLCALYGARLRLYSVLHGESYVEVDVPSSDAIEVLASTARQRGVKVEVRRRMAPHIGQAIVKEAEDPAVGYVVLGLRRRSPVGKVVMGSVAQHVLLNASCPVFAIKAEMD